jgi:tetratricopeptide (TPR) repeat protein
MANTAAPAAGLVERLRALADRRHQSPAAVHDEVRELLQAMRQDDVAWATAHWVLGLARHELGDPAQAVVAYEEAARVAGQAHDAHTESLARASLAISLLSVGDAPAARHEISRAGDLAPPSARGLVDLLAALVLQRTGELDRALAVYDDALTHLRRDQDGPNIARLLVNRGTLHAYQGHFDVAVRDLAEAEELAAELELWVLVAMAAHNLGFTLGRRGEVPAALAAFDRAEEAYAARQGPTRLIAALTADRCEVFLGVGLAQDAAVAAEHAVSLLRADGDTAYESEARLLLARARLALGQLDAAQVDAAAAAEAFRAAGRDPWAAQSAYVAMQAQVRSLEDAAGPPAVSLVEDIGAIVGLLEGQGWPVEAMHARTFLARVALALDQPEAARKGLADVARARRHGPADLRVEAWHATALLRLADGDRGGAKRALRRGLRVLDEHRAALGATELRSGAAAQGAELARQGLRLALDERRASDVLRWAEAWRAGALRLPPVVPPDDAVLTAALEDLRDARSAMREAALDGEGSAELQQRVEHLEGTVRARTMHTAVEERGSLAQLDLSSLRARLDGSALVELLTVEGRLHAVTIVAGRARLHDLGTVDVVVEEQAHLRAALRRLLVAPPASAAADSARRALTATAARLDGLLLGALRLPDVPLVIVPTGALHGLSWSALPSLRHRAVTVTPSAQLWQRGRQPLSRGSAPRVALVAGPDLPGAAEEVERLAAARPGATVLQGDAATTAAVRSALEDADLVHLAAHGSFRSDAPLFSSLRLADGLLTVYELERLRSVPTTLVLPACDAAVVAVRPGDELLGTAAALVGLGVTSVLAPVLPIPDVTSTPLMLAVHDRLAAGDDPSAALAAAAQRDPDDPVALAFVCIGADARGG